MVGVAGMGGDGAGEHVSFTHVKNHAGPSGPPRVCNTSPTESWGRVWLGPCFSVLFCLRLSWGVGVGDTWAQDGTTDSAGHTIGGRLRRDDVVPVKTLGEGSRWDTSSPPLGVCSPILGERGKG